MALPCVEVVHVPSTDSYRSKPVETIQPALDICKDAPGNLKLYHGLQNGESPHIVVVNVWDKLESHQKFQSDPIAIEHFLKVMVVSDESKEALIHVNPTTDPLGTFAAPLTVVTTVRLKAGQLMARLEAALVDLVRAETELPESWELIHAAWGPTVEKEDAVVMFAGPMGRSALLQVPLQRLEGCAELDVMIVPLATFK
ncbi:hypothetical protein B0H21DRAFT_823258 [Amylocystis lapponica]|nr:hypothetical protein B0H21DRAFT_823258 [Amylocystis lapponica]